MIRALVARVEDHGWRRVRRWQDRDLRVGLRHDPAGPVAVLSPHLDDAVVNCWSRLTGDEDVVVVNVFTRLPPPGVLVFWDRLVRAADSRTLMEQRLEEDRAALALAGRRAVHLDLAADPYRSARATPTLGDIDRAVTAALPDGVARVLAPAVLAVVHPDHLLVREYARAVAAAGVPVELYADVPYGAQYGWPHWVSGVEPDPYLDPELSWRANAADLPDVLVEDRAQVTHLSPDGAASKLAAMRTYRSQFPMLDRGPIGQLREPQVHGHEVFWSLRPGD